MKQKILVVDDNPHIINKIIDVLSENNADYYFYPAKNGEIAYELAISKMPDLIITDWDMPIVNGIELIKNLKENKQTKEIPIIMATAVMITSKDLQEALNAGAADYIRKPIDPIELVARVQSIIRISEYNKLLIEAKNKELAENALLLIKNNKFNISITKKIQEINCANKKSENVIETIIREIDEKVREDSWLRFELAFETANKDFTKNLLQKHPTITNSEIKLCVFLKLGMNTKDIATITYKTPESLKVARHRLRKKLELSAKQNLITYFSLF